MKEIDSNPGLREWLLQVFELVWRVALTYLILISMDLIISAILRNHEVDILYRIMGRDYIEKLHSLQGVELLEYIVRDITKMIVPVYAIFIALGAVKGFWDGVHAGGKGN